jgi:hypothetical protein
LAALIVFSLVGGTAYAADSLQRRGGLGKVIDIRGKIIVVENQLGTFDIHTDSETVFRIKDVENPTLADIEVGDVVAGAVTQQGAGRLLAKLVAVVPPLRERMRGLGKVTEVGADSLTVETRNGETHTILVDAQTVFRVKDVENPTLADIEVDDLVAGVVAKGDDGSLLAKLVAVVPLRPLQD